jgi:hypothetical protein
VKIIESIKDSKYAKRTYIALVHRIKLNEANWKKKYLISLVETAFFYKDDHSLDNLINIQVFLKSEDITLFEIYEHELKDAINELEGKSFLLKTPYGWKLAEHRKAELEKATNEWLNLEQKVKEDWLENITSKYPNIQQDDKTQLWAQLIENFVMKIFLRHGAETSKLIFRHPIPDEEEFLESCQNILENSMRKLPSHLREIARNEYSLFFNPDNFARRQYIMGLLDASLSQFAIAIPEESLQSIYNVTSLELKLFLDTNFLFSCLNLTEHHLNESVREVLKFQQTISRISGGKMKIKFYYTTETLDEFKKTIDSTISKLNGSQVNKPIARAAIKSEKLTGLDFAYFKKLADSDISISSDEFFKPYRYGAERLLKKKGIEVYNRQDISIDDIRYAQEVIDDTYEFDTYLKSRDKEREWPTIEHDIRLWHYTKKMRESFLPMSFSDIPFSAIYFVLTLDYQFLSFDRHKFKNRNESTICLLPTQFLHMLNLFVPRTEDFEKTFILSIKTPMAKTIDIETEKVSLNILKAMAVYKDFSEDIAIEILLDEALQTEAKTIKDPEIIRKLIEDKLSIELINQRQRYQEDVIKLQKEKRTQGEKIAEKDVQISQMENKLVQYERRIKELEEFKNEVENKKQPENKGQKKKLEENKLHKLKPLSKFVTKFLSLFAWLVNFIKNLWDSKVSKIKDCHASLAMTNLILTPLYCHCEER